MGLVEVNGEFKGSDNKVFRVCNTWEHGIKVVYFCNVPGQTPIEVVISKFKDVVTTVGDVFEVDILDEVPHGLIPMNWNCM